MSEWRIGKDQEGLRLDQALAALLPEMGIRGRRRLISNSHVLLNGHSAKAASRVKSGDRVEIQEHNQKNNEASGAFLLEVREPYCFFYKPAGLHSARIIASNTPSLEELLGSLIPKKYENKNIKPLQRLDFGTSGIITAALSEEAELAYRRWEKEGLINKYYLAFLEGFLEEPVSVDRALDTSKRRKSRILDKKSSNSTFFTPLHVWEKGARLPLANFNFPDAPITLAGCRLHSGQRHQIRAHASWLGHPLIGDSLYGNGGGNFILQHFALDFPGRFIQLQGAEFLKEKLPASTQEAISAWLVEERRAAS